MVFIINKYDFTIRIVLNLNKEKKELDFCILNHFRVLACTTIIKEL